MQVSYVKSIINYVTFIKVFTAVEIILQLGQRAKGSIPDY